MSLPPPPPPPLSPASAARLAGFSEQQGSPARPPLPPPPPLEPLPQPSLPVVSVPPGLARVALHSAASGASLSNGGGAQGHSPFAAFASAVAAAGSSFAPAAGRQYSLEGLPQPSPHAPRAEDVSPRSVQSSSSEAAEARRVADAAAAAQAAEIAAAAAAAAAAASGTPRGGEGGGRIPTVLSFNHLQSHAESVLSLAAAADGAVGEEQDDYQLMPLRAGWVCTGLVRVAGMEVAARAFQPLPLHLPVVSPLQAASRRVLLLAARAARPMPRTCPGSPPRGTCSCWMRQLPAGGAYQCMGGPGLHLATFGCTPACSRSVAAPPCPSLQSRGLCLWPRHRLQAAAG